MNNKNKMYAGAILASAVGAAICTFIIWGVIFRFFGLSVIFAILSVIFTVVFVISYVPWVIENILVPWVYEIPSELEEVLEA